MLSKMKQYIYSYYIKITKSLVLYNKYLATKFNLTSSSVSIEIKLAIRSKKLE